ncbi:hypothetical protein NMG60_11028340 [Bertholletia excelsa]
MEKLEWRSSRSQAKVVGTIVSIAGALAVTLYKGPPLLYARPSPSSLHRPRASPYSSWAIGGLYLTTDYALVAIWYILLAFIMREYPAELTVMFFYNLCVCLLSFVVGLIAEPHPSAWKIRPDITLASMLCSGVFVSFLNNVVHTWVLHVKGPVYTAMFKPLSIAIAVAMGVLFLGDSLYLGSVIGAILVSIGFYTVMWGKAKEQLAEEDGESGRSELFSTTQRVPLLTSRKTQQV